VSADVDPVLRLRLLAWVQAHRIQRYADGPDQPDELPVLSHSEAVEQLLAIVEPGQDDGVATYSLELIVEASSLAEAAQLAESAADFLCAGDEAAEVGVVSIYEPPEEP
jgi:hypothetical protein